MDIDVTAIVEAGKRKALNRRNSHLASAVTYLRLALEDAPPDSSPDFLIPLLIEVIDKLKQNTEI